MEDLGLCVDLAAALEQQRALKIVEDVSLIRTGGKHELMPTPFQAGYQTACEEIDYRLRTEVWDGALPPVGEKEDDPRDEEILRLRAENEALRRDAETHRAMMRAAGELPDEWEIEILLERGAGTVHLVGPDGSVTMMESDDCNLAVEINAAIDAAMRKEG